MLKRFKSLPVRSVACAAMASALCFVAPVASAADPAPADSKSPLSKGFLALDINRDGYIDYKEATANPALDKVFDAADTDKDGRLTPDEHTKGLDLK